jgi:hypothetical protein
MSPVGLGAGGLTGFRIDSEAAENVPEYLKIIRKPALGISGNEARHCNVVSRHRNRGARIG